MKLLNPNSKNQMVLIFSYFSKMELSSFNISSKESFSYISGNRRPKHFLIFQQTKLSYISRNGNPKKLSIF